MGSVVESGSRELVRTLSPTDGKDRVKGSSVRVTECGAISVSESAGDQSRQAFSAFEMCSSSFAAFFTSFSLGRTDVIIDNGFSQKLGFYGRNGVPRVADSRDSARR